MELRQLQYFVCVVEQGSMGRAAQKLGLVTSALSQQISRLESELSTRLLIRSATGVRPSDAGMAFFQHAQLALRHAAGAVQAAQQARLSGQVAVGLAPSTASVLALPFVQAMAQRYPDVRLRLVESLSGNLAAMLDARQLEMAVLFRHGASTRLSASPLFDERLFVIAPAALLPRPGARRRIGVAALAGVPLVLPSGAHGLRAAVDAAFARVQARPHVVREVDGLAVLMAAVRAGLGATIQPGAVTVGAADDALLRLELGDRLARRMNHLVSLGEDELSPAALAARIVLREVATALVTEGRWPGASLHDS
jgi:LysR family tcuABC transcriptional regulator